jgi:two-component system sensor histidine kinase BaeS
MDLPHLFDHFYRGDKSRDRKSGGTGLGLAIVKQLTEIHGGKVQVESIVGKGSVFYVLLPAQTHEKR